MPRELCQMYQMSARHMFENKKWLNFQIVKCLLVRTQPLIAVSTSWVE